MINKKEFIQQLKKVEKQLNPYAVITNPCNAEALKDIVGKRLVIISSDFIEADRVLIVERDYFIELESN